MRSGLSRRGDVLQVGSIAAAAIMAATLIWKRTGSRRALKDDNEEEVELLDIEKILYMGGEAAISTITWFRGDYQHAAGIVRAKAQQLLEANRWLTGHATSCKLVYNPKKLINLEEYFQCLAPEKSPLARDTALDQLGANSSALLILNGPGQPLFKVSIVPCSKNPSTHFAVVVSMSHIVADGYTFYALHGMLLGGKVEPMVVERIYATRQHQISAMGKYEYSIISSAGFIVNSIVGVLYSKLFGVKVHTHYVLLDTKAMAEAKSAIAPTKEVPFCSTNDILTSWYLQNSACLHGYMAIDWRDRLPRHTKKHAGNYGNLLFFHKEDSSTPGLIRQALDFFQRVVTSRMPTFWEMATGSDALATNWLSFSQPNVIDGCEEVLHMPLYNASTLVPCTMASMCIFRAGPQGPALLLAGTEDQMSGLQSSPFLSKKPITEYETTTTNIL
jgi:hypothetical protein